MSSLEPIYLLPHPHLIHTTALRCRSYFCPHFSDKETEPERMMRFPKVAQLISGRARTQIQVQSKYLFGVCLVKMQPRLTASRGSALLAPSPHEKTPIPRAPIMHDPVTQGHPLIATSHP